MASGRWQWCANGHARPIDQPDCGLCIASNDPYARAGGLFFPTRRAPWTRDPLGEGYQAPQATPLAGTSRLPPAQQPTPYPNRERYQAPQAAPLAGASRPRPAQRPDQGVMGSADVRSASRPPVDSKSALPTINQTLANDARRQPNLDTGNRPVLRDNIAASHSATLASRAPARDSTEEPAHMVVTLKVPKEKLQSILRGEGRKHITPARSETPAENESPGADAYQELLAVTTATSSRPRRARGPEPINNLKKLSRNSVGKGKRPGRATSGNAPKRMRVDSLVAGESQNSGVDGDGDVVMADTTEIPRQLPQTGQGKGRARPSPMALRKSAAASRPQRPQPAVPQVPVQTAQLEIASTRGWRAINDPKAPKAPSVAAGSDAGDEDSDSSAEESDMFVENSDSGDEEFIPQLTSEDDSEEEEELQRQVFPLQAAPRPETMLSKTKVAPAKPAAKKTRGGFFDSSDEEDDDEPSASASVATVLRDLAACALARTHGSSSDAAADDTDNTGPAQTIGLGQSSCQRDLTPRPQEDEEEAIQRQVFPPCLDRPAGTDSIQSARPGQSDPTKDVDSVEDFAATVDQEDAVMSDAGFADNLNKTDLAHPGASGQPNLPQEIKSIDEPAARVDPEVAASNEDSVKLAPTLLCFKTSCSNPAPTPGAYCIQCRLNASARIRQLNAANQEKASSTVRLDTPKAAEPQPQPSLGEQGAPIWIEDDSAEVKTEKEDGAHVAEDSPRVSPEPASLTLDDDQVMPDYDVDAAEAAAAAAVESIASEGSKNDEESYSEWEGFEDNDEQSGEVDQSQSESGLGPAPGLRDSAQMADNTNAQLQQEAESATQSLAASPTKRPQYRPIAPRERAAEIPEATTPVDNSVSNSNEDRPNMGLCKTCWVNPHLPHNSMCQGCKDKALENKIREGLCVGSSCTTKAVEGFQYCARHQEGQREAQKGLYHRRKRENESRKDGEQPAIRPPYQCPICSDGFYVKKLFDRHVNLHTGAKPYACECGYTCSRQDTLARHKKTDKCANALALRQAESEALGQGMGREASPDSVQNGIDANAQLLGEAVLALQPAGERHPCTKCKRWTTENYSWCKICREKRNERRKVLNEERRADGICQECGVEPARTDKVHCQGCADKLSEKKRQAREDKIAAGKCERDGCHEDAAVDFLTCMPHHEEGLRSSREGYARKRAAAVCLDCKGEPAKGRARCAPCAKKVAQYNAARRAAAAKGSKDDVREDGEALAQEAQGEASRRMTRSKGASKAMDNTLGERAHETNGKRKRDDEAEVVEPRRSSRKRTKVQ